MTKQTNKKNNPKISKQKDVTCIIGMHRSGTSMITSILNLCGLDLGPSEQMMKPYEPDNPFGYFENEIISYQINDALLAHFGGSWDNPPELKEGWEFEPSLEKIVEKTRKIIKSFSGSPQWGWKDPRTTILLPFWKSIIPNLRFVICMRSPLEVAKSLARRDRIPIKNGVHLWNHYMRAAIRDTEGYPRIFTFYEDFFKENTSREIIRLVDFCGLQRPGDLTELQNTITRGLKHYTSEINEILIDKNVTTEYKLFYIGLRAFTADGFVRLTSDRSREDLISENISEFVTLLEKFHDENEVAQLQTLLTDKDQQINSHQVTVHKILYEKKQEVKYLRKYLDQKEKENIQFQSTIQKNKKDSELHLKEKLGELQTEINIQKNQLKLKEQQIVERDKGLEDLQVEKNTLEEQNRHLQHGYKLLLNSRSWKITTILSQSYDRLQIFHSNFKYIWQRLWLKVSEYRQKDVRSEMSHSYQAISLKPNKIDTDFQKTENAIRWIPSVEIQTESKPGLFAHPPAQITYSIKVPTKATFQTFVALQPEAWDQNSGGVVFSVSISSIRDRRTVHKNLWSNPHRYPNHRRWMELRLNLHKFQNEKVSITLSTSVPNGETTEYAWAVWGEPIIVTRNNVQPKTEIQDKKQKIPSPQQNIIPSLSPNDEIDQTRKDQVPHSEILFISHDDFRAGASILLLNFLKWFKNKSNIPFNILLKNEYGQLRTEFEKLAPVYIWNKYKNSDKNKQHITQLKNKFKHSNIGLIYSNTITNGKVLDALSDLNCSVISHIHELGYWICNRTEKGNNNQVKKNTHRYIAVSQAVKQSLIADLGISANKIDIVYEFIPIQQSLNGNLKTKNQIRKKLKIPQTAQIVGASGTTDWRKGADLFIQLARAVRQRKSKNPIHFIWVGGDNKGPKFSELSYDIKNSGLEKFVHFVGTRENPLDYYDTFDVFAMVSREDPFPLVNLESASLGKPIICFDKSGGSKEFVEDDCGFIVPYLDFESMADRIIELLNNPELRHKLGKRASQKVRERHDLNVAAPKILSLVEGLFEKTH